MKSILAIFTILLLAASCSPPREEEAPALNNVEVLARLMELEQAAMERWRNGDPGAYLELTSPADYSYYDPALETRLDGKKALEAYYEPLFGEISYEGSEFVNPKVQVHGYAAVFTYNYISSGSLEDGTPWRTPWNVTEVYARSRGRWEMVHSHFTVTGSRKPEKLELPSPPESAAPREGDLLHTLLALEETAMDRLGSGDLQGFLELCAPEVTYFDPATEGRIDGLDRLRVHEASLDYGGPVITDPRVQRHGDLAVLTFNHLSAETGTAWNTTEVYARFGDNWKIVHTHRSYVKGARPPVD